MDLHLEGKVIFVTGGFKGIGKGIALQLAREGAVPVVLNRKDGVEDEFRAEISEITKTFEMYYIDLNDTDAIKPIVEEVYKKYGHIDGVVNNAGRNDNLELETTSWQDFEKSLHGNLTHYFELVHETCPYLKESKGSIVNIASKVALTGQGKTTAYAAAKGAILGLTREWAAALVHDSVRVNAIVVAEAWTPLYANWIKTFGDEEAPAEASVPHHGPHPAGAPYDHLRGDRRHRGLPALRPRLPHHRPVVQRRRRLRQPRSRPRLALAWKEDLTHV